MEIMVIGKDIKQIKANSHPLTRARMRQETNAVMNVINIETFSPKPSSSFNRSLENFDRKYPNTKKKTKLTRTYDWRNLRSD